MDNSSTEVTRIEYHTFCTQVSLNADLDYTHSEFRIRSHGKPGQIITGSAMSLLRQSTDQYGSEPLSRTTSPKAGPTRTTSVNVTLRAVALWFTRLQSPITSPNSCPHSYRVPSAPGGFSFNKLSPVPRRGTETVKVQGAVKEGVPVLPAHTMIR